MGRLSAFEVKFLDILVAAAPGGRIDSNYLVEIEKEPLKDTGNLRSFLQTASDRVAGKEVGQEALSPEELEKLEVE